MNDRRPSSTRSRRLGRIPMVERLDRKLLPTTLTWTGAVSGLWSNPANWNSGNDQTPNTLTPEPEDDLVFPSSSPNENMEDDLTYLDPVGSIESDPQGTSLTMNSFTFDSTSSDSYTLKIDSLNSMSQGSELTLQGAISGAANLTTEGPGSLVFNAQNLGGYTGLLAAKGPIKVGGSTRVPKKVAILQGGQLSVTNNMVTPQVPSLEDDGQLNLTGNLETLTTLTGTGTVSLGGASGGFLEVGSTGTAATQGTVTVDPSGTISPGTSTTSGPLTIDGTVNFSSGSTLAITLGSSGPYDELVVPDDATSANTVNLNNATLDLNLSTATPPRIYTIVQAPAINGQFSNLQSGPQTIQGIPVVVAYTSTAVTLTVQGPTPTMTTLVPPTSAAVYDVPVPLVAIVSATNGVGGMPVGSVDFFNQAGQLIGNASVINGVASTSALLQQAGSVVSIVAVYNGIDDYENSYSSVIDLEVLKATPTVHLIASPIISRHKTTGADLTVIVSPELLGTPTGQVTLSANKKKIKTTRLSEGEATIKLSLSATLGKTFTVLYSGDSDFNQASSTPVSVGKKSFNSAVSSESLHEKHRNHTRIRRG